MQKTPDSNFDPRIDAHVQSIPDGAAPQERDERKLLSSRIESGFQVERWQRLYDHGGLLRPIYAPHADVIFPGSLVQGASLINGIPSPIPVPRGGGILAISSHTGAPSTKELKEVSLGTVNDAINEIVHAQASEFPAQFTFTMRQVRSREEIQIEIGASASYMGIFDGSAHFELDSRANNVAYLVTLKQSHYSIAFQRPGVPHAFCAPGVTLEQVAPYVGQGNPAAYLSEVTYGRVFYLLIQSTESTTRIGATLEANLNLGIYGGGTDGSAKYLTDLRDLKISAYAYGGDPAAVRQAILGGLSSWTTVRTNLIGSKDGKFALPVEYTVRSLATNDVVKNAINADYGYEVRSILGEQIPVLMTPAANSELDNGCGVVRNLVDWTFRWASTPNTDLYELQVSHSSRGVFATTQTKNTQDSVQSYSALPPQGWSWRVRAHANGIWQPWSTPRAFHLEPPNSDCQTGVWIYTHPNYVSARTPLFLPAVASALDVDLERYSGWDDEIDSIKLVNLKGVTLFQDPLRAPWNGGHRVYFRESAPNVSQQGFPTNAASALRFDLGLDF